MAPGADDRSRNGCRAPASARPGPAEFRPSTESSVTSCDQLYRSPFGKLDNREDCALRISKNGEPSDLGDIGRWHVHAPTKLFGFRYRRVAIVHLEVRRPVRRDVAAP